MQKPVNHIKSQFGMNVMTSVSSFGLRYFDPDHQLADQLLGFRLAQRKSENISRLIVMEIALVEPVDRWIIHENQAYL